MGKILCLGLFFCACVQAQPNIDYPQDYRQWTHIKSMLIEPGHPLHASFGGIHHLYANAKALQGYTEGGNFPEGAIIAFDLLEAERGGHAVVEGKRKVLGLMKKDSSRFASTGGWGFEGFAKGDPGQAVVGKNAEEACYGCHTARKDADYVFSNWRD